MDISSVDSVESKIGKSSPAVSNPGAVKNPIVSAGSPASTAGTPVSQEALSKAVNKLNSGPLSSSLSFSTDKDTGLSVVKISDKATGDVIRQLPSKEALALASAIDSELHDKVGQLINQKA